MKHKHADLIHAWADGAVIERLWNDPHYKDQAWLIDKEPAWEEYCEYRIKPEPKPDIKEFLYLVEDGTWKSSASIWKGFYGTKKPLLMLLWDGETGELKSAEVLK